MINKNPEGGAPHAVETLIGEKTEIKGDITFSGGLHVDGKVSGNITASSDANGKLVVSENARVDGNVDAAYIVVNGTVNGNLTSTKTVELQAKANITGDVHYKALQFDMGAKVNGNLVCDTVQNDSPWMKSQPARSAVGAKPS